MFLRCLLAPLKPVQDVTNKRHLLWQDQGTEIGSHKLRLAKLAVAQQLKIFLSCFTAQLFKKICNVWAASVDSFCYQRPGHGLQKKPSF